MTVARPIWLQNLAAYTADEFRTLIDAQYATPGIVRGAALVGPNGPVAANVTVQPGFVVVGAKSAANGKYLTEITATEVVTITANSSGNPRIDNIVMEVLDTAFSDASDIAHVIAVPGTPAGSPTAPTVLANQTLLAQVAVANGFSTIVSGNITDMRQSAVSSNGNTRLKQSTFSTDLVSSGTTEVVGYSQAASLVAGRRYRVNFKGYMNGGAANNIAAVRIRFATGTVTTASTQAGTNGTLNHATSGSTGRGTCAFFAEFTAPTTAVYNIAVGVTTFVGTSNETVLGSVISTEVTIDDVGV